MIYINRLIDNELEKIPQKLEKERKKEWRNVGVLSYSNTSKPSQRRNNIKKQNEKVTSNKQQNNNLKTNDYSVCDKNSIINQEVIRKVLLHKYP